MSSSIIRLYVLSGLLSYVSSPVMAEEAYGYLHCITNSQILATGTPGRYSYEYQSKLSAQAESEIITMEDLASDDVANRLLAQLEDALARDKAFGENVILVSGQAFTAAVMDQLKTECREGTITASSPYESLDELNEERDGFTASLIEYLAIQDGTTITVGRVTYTP